jgi:hypothetical protein
VRLDIRVVLLVTIVAALMILGVAALGLILAQKGSTPTAMVVSTVHIASATQEVPARPARAPVSQIAQATGSEVSPLIDAQTGSAMTTGVQAPSAAAAAQFRISKPEHYFQGCGP